MQILLPCLTVPTEESRRNLFFLIVIKADKHKNAYPPFHNYKQEIYHLEENIIWYVFHNIAL